MSFDDFTQIKKTILGNASIKEENLKKINFQIIEKVFGKTFKKDLENIFKFNDEIREDRQNFKNILMANNIDVVDVQEPSLHNVLQKKSLPFGSVRDLLFVYGKDAIRCNTNDKLRKQEIEFLLDFMIFDDVNFTSLQTYNQKFSICFFKCDPNIKFKSHEFILDYYHKHKNDQLLSPAIDGANLIKIGDMIYGNVSNLDMIGGFLNIQDILSKRYPSCRFKMISVCKKHIDGTIIIIKPGLLLLHSGMMNSWERVLPIEIRNWDKIFFSSDDIEIKSFNASFHTYGSTDINCLSLNENLVCVLDYVYPYLSKELKKYQVECIPVKMRHQDLWGGALHCITNEIEREGGCTSYV